MINFQRDFGRFLCGVLAVPDVESGPDGIKNRSSFVWCRKKMDRSMKRWAISVLMITPFDFSRKSSWKPYQQMTAEYRAISTSRGRFPHRQERVDRKSFQVKSK